MASIFNFGGKFELRLLERKRKREGRRGERELGRRAREKERKGWGNQTRLLALDLETNVAYSKPEFRRGLNDMDYKCESCQS